MTKHRIIFKISVLIFLGIILLSIITFSAHAQRFKNYTEIVELEPDKAKVEADMILLLPINNFSFSVPSDAENISISIKDSSDVRWNSSRICIVNKSIINCKLSPGQFIIKISYETQAVLNHLKEGILFKSSYESEIPATSFKYVVMLPKGYILPEEKSINYFITPAPSYISSDGRSILLIWRMEQVSERKEFSFFFKKPDDLKNAKETGILIVSNQEREYLPFWIGIPFLIIVISTFYVFKRKQKNANHLYTLNTNNPHENIENIEYVSLLDHEKKVVEILKEAENRTLWQKQIQIKSGFSKVKLSRLIKALEARGVVKKEPWGNTNKIILLNHRSLGENEENVSEEKGAENGGEKDEEKSEEKKPSLEKKEINEEEETQDP